MFSRVQGVIDRRILVNYAVEPDILDEVIPSRFTPKTVGGKGIGGICLIRLKNMRLPGIPSFAGFSSENAAHRIAVEWEEDGARKEGVYVPRRDTSSLLNTAIGGRFFPGVYHHASFEVEESGESFEVRMRNEDDGEEMYVRAQKEEALPPNSVFGSVDEISSFFREGSLGYSPRGEDTYDCVELNAYKWEVEPLSVEEVYSSYFEDSRFPSESVSFDSALLMEDISHEWRGGEPMCVPD